MSIKLDKIDPFDMEAMMDRIYDINEYERQQRAFESFGIDMTLEQLKSFENEDSSDDIYQVNQKYSNKQQGILPILGEEGSELHEWSCGSLTS